MTFRALEKPLCHFVTQRTPEKIDLWKKGGLKIVVVDPQTTFSVSTWRKSSILHVWLSFCLKDKINVLVSHQCLHILGLQTKTGDFAPKHFVRWRVLRYDFASVSVQSRKGTGGAFFFVSFYMCFNLCLVHAPFLFLFWICVCSFLFIEARENSQLLSGENKTSVDFCVVHWCGFIGT